VNGRLLTIDSVSLVPAASEAQAGSSKSKADQLTGTISATAYVLPPGSSALAGATPSAPAGTGSTTSTTSSGSPAAPATAVIKANP
jgi:hypothetical protein